jgi:nicotinamide phosphoribosyltransferase
MNPLLLCDAYKVGHVFQYPKETEYVYSNGTPRKSRIKGIDSIVFVGIDYVVQEYLVNQFNQNFFNRPKLVVVNEYKRIIDATLGGIATYEHIEKLHDLGYLPIEIKALPEGSIVPMKVPAFTIINTHPDFYWVTNFLETLISNVLWQTFTSATIAYEYKKILTKWALETNKEAVDFVNWQGHDFSMRGMSSLESTVLSGFGHLTSFTGTDSIPAILFAEKYYGANVETELVGGSVAATEHSVMSSGSKEEEIETFERLITDVYPSGIVSIVSDTWDLWKVCTEYLPILKDKILARDGKVVIRPDSGDPVDILCGSDVFIDRNHYEKCQQDENCEVANASQTGVIELLWEVFGGTINEQGYKVLDPHIGAIYGDSITLERAEQICERLARKGFASTNVVFGIGSYTYQYNTRDTFGFAMKATMVIVNGEERVIYKQPVTDDGTKVSAKGWLRVDEVDGVYTLADQVSREHEGGCLETIFKDGVVLRKTKLSDIREKLKI